MQDLLDASVAIRSKMSLTKEFRMAMALLEIPVSGWTCLRTGRTSQTEIRQVDRRKPRTLIDVRRVGLLSDLLALLLVTVSGGRLGGLLCGLCAVSLSGSLGGGGSRGLAGSGSGFGGHCKRVKVGAGGGAEKSWRNGVVAAPGYIYIHVTLRLFGTTRETRVAATLLIDCLLTRQV